MAYYSGLYFKLMIPSTGGGTTLENDFLGFGQEVPMISGAGLTHADSS